LWSTGIAYSMQDETDILNVLYGELMNETTQVAPMGKVCDSRGEVLKSWPDGLPGKLRFTLPEGESKFVIITDEHKIVQDIR